MERFGTFFHGTLFIVKLLFNFGLIEEESDSGVELAGDRAEKHYCGDECHAGWKCNQYDCGEELGLPYGDDLEGELGLICYGWIIWVQSRNAGGDCIHNRIEQNPPDRQEQKRPNSLTG